MLTEQQKAELERRGWHEVEFILRCPGDVVVQRGECRVRILESGHIHTLLMDEQPTVADIVELAAVLGIAPRGYRLVQEEVAEKVFPLVREWAQQKQVVAELLIGSEEREEAREEHRLLAALASALSPKEVELCVLHQVPD